jgi:hypothetical protein
VKELIDFIFVRLYYRLFVRPSPAAKAASEWDIDLPGMKAVYRGSPQSQEQSLYNPRGIVVLNVIFSAVRQ